MTSRIVATGIRPASRRDPWGRGPLNVKGVYVYPFSRSKVLHGNWRRILKCGDGAGGNYNGYVFRLEDCDFPLYAGTFYGLRDDPAAQVLESQSALAAAYGDLFTGEVVQGRRGHSGYDWDDFEIILPRRVEARRIIRVVRDREPGRRRPAR